MSEESGVEAARPLRGAGWAALLIAVVVALEQWTSLDVRLENLFFDPLLHTWLIDPDAALPRLLFYTGPKRVLIVFGLALLALAFWPAGRARFGWTRRGCLLAFASLAVAPLLVGAGKSLTNVHCPCELRIYGGTEPYVKLLSRHSAEDPPTKRGRCFPAAHASGGFGLFGLIFLARGHRGRRIAIATGLAVGWIFGLYQQARGVHFFSHTLVSMALTWLIVVALDRLWGERAAASVASGA